jgi:hypothetical protein
MVAIKPVIARTNIKGRELAERRKAEKGKKEDIFVATFA